MSVKVGNLVTDEKNVKEVLSVEDGEQMMGRSVASESSAGGSTNMCVYSFSVVSGDTIVVGGSMDSSSGGDIRGVIITNGQIRGFSYEGGNQIQVTPLS